MKTTPTYHVSLRAHQLAVARLEREHLVRLEAWCAKQSRHERPSLEDFVDEVILDSGCLADGGHSEVDPFQFRFLFHEEENEPYAQIGIFSSYGRDPIPACYFEISWHTEIASEKYRDVLEQLSAAIYLSMGELCAGAAADRSQIAVRH